MLRKLDWVNIGLSATAVGIATVILLAESPSNEELAEEMCHWHPSADWCSDGPIPPDPNTIPPDPNVPPIPPDPNEPPVDPNEPVIPPVDPNEPIGPLSIIFAEVPDVDYEVPVRTTLRWDSGGGDREEIGLFTEWQYAYMANGNHEDLIVSQADLAATYPWCDLNAMRGEPYNYSFTHTPNAFFIPYLMRGTEAFIEPQECQFEIFVEYRNGLADDGHMKYLTGRELAWQLRNLGQLAYLQKMGVTTRNNYDYGQVLADTRDYLWDVRTHRIRAEFHLLGEDLQSDTNSWTAWFEGYIGVTVNHLINMGFVDWKPVTEWHFNHVRERCGMKWPLSYCDNGYVNDENALGGDLVTALWETTNPYRFSSYMECIDAVPIDELVSANDMKCGDSFMTYQDRAMVARSWASMGAINGLTGAMDLYNTLDEAIGNRGDTQKWYKWSMLPIPHVWNPDQTEPPPVDPCIENPEAEGCPCPVRAYADTYPDCEDLPIPPDPNTPTGSNEDLVNLPAGEWYTFPDSKYRDLVPAQSFEQPINYIVGPKAMSTAWNGAVFDTKRQRLDIVASGGHADYCGNDHLGFWLDTGEWTLVREPSDLTDFDRDNGSSSCTDVPEGQACGRGVAPDGRATSRHTYSGQSYDSLRDKSLLIGGSICSGAGSPTNQVWYITPESEHEMVLNPGGYAQLGWSMTYVEELDVFWGSASCVPKRYNPRSNVIHSYTNFGACGRTGQSSTYDTKRLQLFAFGHWKCPECGGYGSTERTTAYIFPNSSKVHQYVEPTGDLEIYTQYGIGLEYVAERDFYVAWNGGDDVFLINPETFNVTKYTISGGPGPVQQRNGQYGRFSYSALYGGFVVASEYDKDVMFFKIPMEWEAL